MHVITYWQFRNFSTMNSKKEYHSFTMCNNHKWILFHVTMQQLCAHESCAIPELGVLLWEESLGVTFDSLDVLVCCEWTCWGPLGNEVTVEGVDVKTGGWTTDDDDKWLASLCKMLDDSSIESVLSMNEYTMFYIRIFCLLPDGVIVPVSKEFSLSENFLSLTVEKHVTESLPFLILSSLSLTLLKV